MKLYKNKDKSKGLCEFGRFPQCIYIFIIVNCVSTIDKLTISVL